MKEYVKNNNGLVQAFNPRIPIYNTSHTWVSGEPDFYIASGSLWYRNIKVTTTASPNIHQVGEIRKGIWTTAPNDDWLICDGSTFDASVYPELYTLLGNTNVLPDMRQAVMVGSSSNLISYYEANIKRHKHSVATKTHSHTASISNHTHSGYADPSKIYSSIESMYIATNQYDFADDISQNFRMDLTDLAHSNFNATPTKTLSITCSTPVDANGNDISTTIMRAEQIGVNFIIRGK